MNEEIEDMMLDLYCGKDIDGLKVLYHQVIEDDGERYSQEEIVVEAEDGCRQGYIYSIDNSTEEVSFVEVYKL